MKKLLTLLALVSISFTAIADEGMWLLPYIKKMNSTDMKNHGCNSMFFEGYMDDLVYNNSPVNYLSNMPEDHPYISMYNSRNILIVVGQGAWEGPLKESTDRLNEVLYRKGIHATIDYWGYDVAHDWPWWYKMVEHYGPRFF